MFVKREDNIIDLFTFNLEKDQFNISILEHWMSGRALFCIYRSNYGKPAWWVSILWFKWSNY
jgi:hypothetical protein